MKRSVWPAKGRSEPRGRRLQQPDHGSADGHHAAAATAAGVDPLDRFLGDASPFRVHRMLGQPCGLDRRKVPAPTCKVTRQSVTPAASNCSSSLAVKCRPAVGAATARDWRRTPFGSSPGPRAAFPPCGCREAAAPGLLVPTGKMSPRSTPATGPAAVGQPGHKLELNILAAFGVAERHRFPLASRPRVLQSKCQSPPDPSPDSPSQRPPVLSRAPISRAGTTRVSLSTRQSPRRRSSGRSRMCQCVSELCLRETISSRASARRAMAAGRSARGEGRSRRRRVPTSGGYSGV